MGSFAPSSGGDGSLNPFLRLKGGGVFFLRLLVVQYLFMHDESEMKVYMNK